MEEHEYEKKKTRIQLEHPTNGRHREEGVRPRAETPCADQHKTQRGRRREVKKGFETGAHLRLWDRGGRTLPSLVTVTSLFFFPPFCFLGCQLVLCPPLSLTPFPCPFPALFQSRKLQVHFSSVGRSKGQKKPLFVSSSIYIKIL